MIILSKAMTKLKDFADKQTDGPIKNYIPPKSNYGGIKRSCWGQNAIYIYMHVHHGLLHFDGG